MTPPKIPTYAPHLHHVVPTPGPAPVAVMGASTMGRPEVLERGYKPTNASMSVPFRGDLKVNVRTKPAEKTGEAQPSEFL